MPSLNKALGDDLYRFIWGVQDHVHILTSLHPSVQLATLHLTLTLQFGVEMASFNNVSTGTLGGLFV